VSVRAYPAYRESGVEWAGYTPSHWHIFPLKRSAKLVTDRADRRSFPVALENIEGWSGRFLDSEGDYSGDGTAFQRGDLLFGKLRPYLAKAWLADQGGEAIGDFHVIRVLAGQVPRYLQYVILTREVISLIDGSTQGAKMPRASWDFLGSLMVPAPPRVEQSAIAAFLDRETGKIDALVAEQERLIALLREKRQAVISEAVTKGLDPIVPMKDSGVEWLGEVPAHWEVRSISSLTTKITNGYVGPTRDIFVDEGIRYLQSLHIKNNKINFHTPYYVSSNWSASHKKSELAAGDVLVVQTGDIGQAAVVEDEFAGCNCHALIILAPLARDLTGQWLSWTLNSPYGRQSLLAIQTGALHPHLNCGDVRDIRIPLPTLDEQSEIVKYLEQKLANFDQLEAEAQAAITLLRERRSALISAAVTGKIDVRDHAVAEQDAAA